MNTDEKTDTPETEWPKTYRPARPWRVMLAGIVGLAENAVDHRADTRTVSMNPAFRFPYWNMHYHLEHHIFPRGQITRFPGCMF